MFEDLPPKKDGWQIPRMVEEGVTNALRNVLPEVRELLKQHQGPTMWGNIKRSWRMFSNHVAALLAMAAAYWLQMDPADQAALMAQYPKLKAAAPWIGFGVWYIARVIPQKSVSGK